MHRVFLILLLAAIVPGAMAQPAPAPANRPSATAPPATGARPSQSVSIAAPPVVANDQAKIDLNLGTAEDLQTLPGIGPARAQSLVAHRPYASVTEAGTKGGLPRPVLDAVRNRLSAFQVDVNKATREEMIRLLPGVGEARADHIVRGRPYGAIDELASKGGVPQAVLAHLRPVLRLN